MNQEELIQGFYTNSLTQQQQEQLQQQLASDATFREAFESYKDVQLAFQHHEAQVLKERLKAVEDQLGKTTPWFRKPWMYYAAASVVVFGLCYNFLFTSTNLYENYHDVFPNVHQPVIRGDEPRDGEAGFVAYENGDFVMAAAAFEEALRTQEDVNVRFYYALSLLNSEQTSMAIKQLEKLALEDFKFKPQAQWYLVLSYLQANQDAEAYNQLQSLQQSDSDFKRQERKQLQKELSARGVSE